MSLQLIIVALSLFLGAFIFGGLIAFSLHRLPAPRMRAHRHARLAQALDHRWTGERRLSQVLRADGRQGRV